jgi:hypothetical protein
LHRLQTRQDIRKDQIGVWGHSQGGWIAPLTAALSSDVAVVIAQSLLISCPVGGVLGLDRSDGAIDLVVQRLGLRDFSRSQRRRQPPQPRRLPLNPNATGRASTFAPGQC